MKNKMTERLINRVNNEFWIYLISILILGVVVYFRNRMLGLCILSGGYTIHIGLEFLVKFAISIIKDTYSNDPPEYALPGIHYILTSVLIIRVIVSAIIWTTAIFYAVTMY